jgi:hypothetical protein
MEVSTDRISPAVPSEAWIERLAFMLMTGTPLKVAVASCQAENVSPEQVLRRATELVADPCFKAATTLAMRLKCRDWWLRTSASLARLGEGPSHVDVRRDLDPLEFVSDYVARNRAVHLPGLAAGWPACTEWTHEYLASTVGGAQVDVMFNREAFPSWQQNTSNRLRRSMSFGEYLELVFNGGAGNDYYLVSKNQFFANPDTHVLLSDIVMPPYVRVEDPGDSIRLWFGPAGTITQLHHDDRNLLLAQVVGRKRIRMYAPYFADAMEQRMPWYAEVDPLTADPSAHPHAAQAVCSTIQLEAGDALFIPVGWWHALEALDVSITLTFRNFPFANEYGMP